MSSANSISYLIRGTELLPVRRYVGTSLLFLLFACLWFREYESFDGPAGIIYTQLWGNFRVVDALLFGIGAVHFLLMIIGRRSWLSVPSSLSRPGVLFLCSLLAGAVHGRMNGGTHVFFDWREFVMALFLIPVFAYWIRTQRELDTSVKVFCVVMLCRVAYIFIAYLQGGGVTDVVAGIRTPFFDGPTVSGVGLTGLMAFRFREEAATFAERYYWLATALCAFFFVIVCFRRVYWGELFVGTLILLILNRRIILKNLPLIGLVLALALGISGRMLYQRLSNLAPSASDPVYAATNMDHLNDILDAFDHIKEHPIAGIGVGVPYQTFRIVGWKTESWGVHNAILHVWLLYGLFGLLTYVWLHFRLFGWLKSEARNRAGRLGAFAQVTFAFAVAQFLMTLGFAPSPYGSLQNVIVTSFLLGAIFGVSAIEKGLLGPDYTSFPFASLCRE
jgi:hypothetical protein